MYVSYLQNGGDSGNGQYNYPLRGTKGTIWEGGVLSLTVLWGGVLNRVNYTSSELFHAVDWMPTLLNIAGGNTGN